MTRLSPRADDCAPLEHWVVVLLIVDVDPNPLRLHQFTDHLLQVARVVFDGQHLQIGIDKKCPHINFSGLSRESKVGK